MDNNGGLRHNALSLMSNFNFDYPARRKRIRHLQITTFGTDLGRAEVEKHSRVRLSHIGQGDELVSCRVTSFGLHLSSSSRIESNRVVTVGLSVHSFPCT